MRRDDLLVVVPPRMAPGFRLAGTRTEVVDDNEAARAVVEREVAAGSRGVIALAAPLWAGLPPRLRAAWEARTVPLVVALPDEGGESAEARRDRVRALLARSVGYEITFTPGEDSA